MNESDAGVVLDLVISLVNLDLADDDDEAFYHDLWCEQVMKEG